MAILDYWELALLGLDGLVVFGFYKAYKHFSKDADVIEGLPIYTVGPELYSYVDKLPNKCLPYVGICGLSKMSKDARIQKRNFPGVGLIHKTVAIKHKQIETSGIWNSVTKQINSVVRSCKFGICAPDSSTSKNDPSLFVEVRDPLHAEYLLDNLPIIRNDYQPGSDLIKFRDGEFIKGYEYKEFTLPEGVPVFGVGKIFISSDKAQLCFGSPDLIKNKYILTTLTKPEVMDSLRGKAKLSKYMFYTILFIGTAVAGWLVYKFLSRNNNQTDDIQMDDIQMDDIQMGDMQIDDVACNICLASLRNILLLPCKHLIVCSDCYKYLPSPKHCPMCRTLVSECLPIHMT